MLLNSSFVVSSDAASVDVSPRYASRLPPTVILTRFGSAFFGLTATTVRAYVTRFPLGTFDFVIQWHVLVPVTLLVPTSFLPVPLDRRPNLFAAALDHVASCLGSFYRSLYSMDFPVVSSITAHALYLYSC